MVVNRLSCHCALVSSYLLSSQAGKTGSRPMALLVLFSLANLYINLQPKKGDPMRLLKSKPFIAAALAALGLSAALAADTYNIDPMHSMVGFSVTHLVIN